MSERLSKADEIHLEVGRCLAAWSAVELNMAATFTAVHITNWWPALDYKALRASYDAVKSFEVRLAMLDASLTISPRVTNLIRDAWPSLSRRLAKGQKQRSELAHFTLIEQHSHYGSELVLAPYLTYTANSQGKHRQPVTLTQLQERRSRYGTLQEELAAYVEWIERRLGYREREDDLRRIIERSNARNPKAQ